MRGGRHARRKIRPGQRVRRAGSYSSREHRGGAGGRKHPLHDLFRKDISAWMSGLKYALRKLGVFATEFSHLSFPLTDDDRRRIDAALEREKDFL